MASKLLAFAIAVACLSAGAVAVFPGQAIVKGFKGFNGFKGFRDADRGVAEGRRPRPLPAEPTANTAGRGGRFATAKSAGRGVASETTAEGRWSEGRWSRAEPTANTPGRGGLSTDDITGLFHPPPPPTSPASMAAAPPPPVISSVAGSPAPLTASPPPTSPASSTSAPPPAGGSSPAGDLLGGRSPAPLTASPPPTSPASPPAASPTAGASAVLPVDAVPTSAASASSALAVALICFAAAILLAFNGQ